MSNNNGNRNRAELRSEQTILEPLNATDQYYMVYAEWVEIQEQPRIASAIELIGERPEAIAVQNGDNFFINMPVPAFYLQNRATHVGFRVKWATAISRKLYEATQFMLNAARATTLPGDEHKQATDEVLTQVDQVLEESHTKSAETSENAETKADDAN